VNGALIVFVILLPFATGLLGAVLGLLDRGDGAATLRRIAWRGLPFVAAGLLLGGNAALPALAAVITAFAIHVGVAGGIRWGMGKGWLTGSSTPWWGD